MKRQYALPNWKWYDLLMMLGTANEISRMLEERGYPPVPRTTLQGWRNRNLLPANWVPVFIKMALDQDLIKDIDDLRSTWDNP
jgi:hypothetical protein